MENFKLKSWKGVDPEKGDPTLMVGLHDVDTGELKGCIAFMETPEGLVLANNLELFKLGNQMGVYRLGHPNPIAQTFLDAPDTVLIAELAVTAEKRVDH